MNKFLINKPQFDTKELEVGTAVKVTSSIQGNWLSRQDALIVEVQPLQMKVMYVREDIDCGHIEKYLEFTPDDIEKSTIKMEFLVPKEPLRREPLFD